MKTVVDTTPRSGYTDHDNHDDDVFHVDDDNDDDVLENNDASEIQLPGKKSLETPRENSEFIKQISHKIIILMMLIVGMIVF